MKKKREFWFLEEERVERKLGEKGVLVFKMKISEGEGCCGHGGYWGFGVTYFHFVF